MSIFLKKKFENPDEQRLELATILLPLFDDYNQHGPFLEHFVYAGVAERDLDAFVDPNSQLSREELRLLYGLDAIGELNLERNSFVVLELLTKGYTDIVVHLMRKPLKYELLKPKKREFPGSIVDFDEYKLFRDL
ncbi:MAG: hypothetical protein WC796_06305 [Candidatus Pacearchaeota archaeon]|jgi:hypothetical protein